MLPMPTDAGLTDPQQTPPAPDIQDPAIPPPGTFSDAQLLEMFKRWKKESFDQRWVFERQWMRNVWYFLNRQWIYFDSKRGQWQDKRLAKWIPRPVTNICKEAIQTVRANFAAINYGANGRPLGEDPINVITADLVDDYAPILYEDYKMNAVMNEFDFWLLTTGNAWIHTCVSYDRANGMVDEHYSGCPTCQKEYSDTEIVNAKQKCPGCGGTDLVPTDKVTQKPLPKGLADRVVSVRDRVSAGVRALRSRALHVRMRWRDKSYYEQNPELARRWRT
jgi:hypothetical protein